MKASSIGDTRRGTGWCALVGLLFVAGSATAAAPAPEPSEKARLATHSLVLDMTEGDARAIAVGERGHILLSESRQPNDWRQVDAPVRSTLTAVTAVGDQVWAVGHDGVILHSGDGGLGWTIQRFDPWSAPDPDAADAAFDPQQGAPLLDVLFLDAQHGFAVGAYALMLRTDDGGEHWQRVDLSASADAAEPASEGDDEAAADGEDDWTFSQDDLALMEESDPHLNAIARTGSGGLLVVAERGAAFRSRDGGATWERLKTPYAGSMFGVLGFDGDHVLAYGLRGHVLESDDLGSHWRELDAGIQLSLMGGAALPDGGAVLVGANGVVLQRANGSAPFTRHTYQTENQETPVLAGVLPLGTTTFVVYGEAGIGRMQLD